MNIKNLLLATTAILLAACSTDSDVLPPQDLGQIRVTASVGAMTRVAHSGNSTTFETNDRISVYAWLGADNNMQRLVVDNSINTLGGDGTWTADPQMLWADNTSDHYFLGIYPERNGATDYDADPYTLDFNNQTASDLLVARTTAKPTGSAVKLEFEHVMAKLVVNLSFRNEWTTAPEVASVTATACTEATVNYLENPVEVTPATGQNLVVIPFTGTSASFAGIMIPGQSGFRTINVTLENGKVYTYTHSADIDLQPGRYTTVNLVLGRDRIELDDAGINVSDWENGTSIDGAEANEAYSYDSNTKTITIYSGEGLKVAADVVNSGDTDINIILDNDIDLTGIDWTPIGTESRPYTGNFDGGGHTITGLKIDKSGTDYVGLIGCLGSGGKVQNVTLTNISVSGANCVGGIAGQNYGTVENCSVNGTVTGKGFTDTGGIAGSNYGTISGCSAEGTVTGSVNVGGIAGGSYLGVIIDGCHSTAAVSGISSVGGVVGNLGNNSFLMACYSTGNVTATITYGYAHVGGVVGINGQGTVTACYHATGEITSLGEGRIGGIVGENYIGTVAACYWENNLSSGTGSNNGRDDTHKVEGTDVTWQTAVAAMNTALQSAGSGWHYVLNGALPTLEEK
ncbi:fimbrillin family protein [Bacteroides gallinaceum]|uniref:fimbrillin family protein n=1 Tax=Bacteroides gallinaceum TaxID=1462571 RepID=UPI0025AB1806|nr:fimbrillin family protein [Bacteroides gallinaceum]MDN0080776.1 fimbrillin family protein [Bacteroides gallinaceum]